MNNSNSTQIEYALLSVSDKTGIVELANGLTQLGIKILSTGGTANTLKEANIPVQDISSFTGFPEMLEGRVKTLHPKLYAGILARGEADKNTLKKQNFIPIGLVVVNLYPFKATIENPNCSLEVAIEQIDIGGPTLLRAAAKNYQYTAGVVSQEDYPPLLKELQINGQISLATRFNLAKKVFQHVAQYDIAIAEYFSEQSNPADPLFHENFVLQMKKKLTLRYGENPHQQAAFYVTEQALTGTISHARQVTGKALSYNNIADADCALECVKQFKGQACVIVKHANPCAVAIAKTQVEAYQKAYHADSTSAFGAILAFNHPLELKTISAILQNQFVEVIIAPEISEEVIKKVQQKPNIRLLTAGKFEQQSHSLELKSVTGGILIQERDNLPTPKHIEVVSERQPLSSEMQDLLFAWQVVRFIKSNAIVFAKDEVTLGIGPGQMSRVFSTKIAALKAKEAGFSLKDASMASDAFFPFADSVEEAHALGITAIIQPGGSIRDKEVIEAANQYQMTMVFTGLRHFKH